MEIESRLCEMKKILIVVGSENIHGNTNLIASSFEKGAKESGHQVKKIVLNEDIQGCKGCLACQYNHHRCVIDDIMQKYYSLFEEADMFVLASPLYFWSVSGRLKSFIDRLYAISKDDLYPYKEVILLMSAGSDSFYAFEQAVSFYRFYTLALGWKNQGMVLAGGCKNQYVSENYIQEAYQLGKNL